MSCPAVDRLLAFCSGEFAEAQTAELETHIDECAECRAVLSNLARGGPPPSLGRYRIDTVLGSGGMGIVYRGFDPQLARPVAIKVVRRAGEDTAGRARLVREAQALARLSHPNVCHVYDVGTEDDEVWVAMELIEGVGLRQWASEGRTRDEVIATLLGAAEGIAAAHAVSLVHRDIKPENVLVTRDGRAIVTDFGLARHEDMVDVHASTVSTDPHLTATGAIAGTPAYLAPEQLLGDPIDVRVDQFAWAVMAWELLVGSRPFPIVFAVRVEAVRAGVQLPKDLPRHLGTALAKAMSASPNDRFGSMRELIAAIRAQPTRLTRGATVGPIVPLRGRNAAIAGLLVLAAAAVAAFAWPARRASPTTSAPAPLALAPAPPVPIDEPAIAPRPEPAPAAHEVAAVAVPTETSAAASPPPPTSEPVKSPRKQAVAAPPPRARTTTAPQLAAPAPTPSDPSDARDESTPRLSAREPQPPVALPAPRPAGRGYCRSCQVATVDAFCVIPTDFANPGTKSNAGVVDWGTVTKLEVETGTFGEQPLRQTVITLRGQRKVYRFTADFLNTRLDTQVGALLAVCTEGDSDIYKLTGGPTDITRAVITLTGAPRTLPAAKLGAKHIPDIRLAAASTSKTLGRLEENGRYLVHAKIHGVAGPTRYRMDRYFLDVPNGLKNEELLAPGNHVWMVVEKPVLEEIADKKMLVVRAAAVLQEVFP
jgi:serine/threonine protein kinase